MARGVLRKAGSDLAGSNSIASPELEDHIRSLRRYARALVGGSADADDIVQETLKRALVYVDDGKEIHNLRSYLLTILHRVRLDHLKREGRSESVSMEDGNVPGVRPQQHDHLECQEVAKAIQALPEEQREVVLLVAMEGLSYQDAAEIFDVPIGTVMSRLNRGRKAIRDRLSHIGSEVLETEHEASRNDVNRSIWPRRRISPEIVTNDGILGVYGNTLTIGAAEALGRAFGCFTQAHVRSHAVPRVAVCFDGRKSSPDLATALTTGLVRSGAKVLRLGRGPLPLLKFGSRELRADASVMITGTNAGLDHNGFRFFLRGKSLRKSEIRRIMHAKPSTRALPGRVIEMPMVDRYLRYLCSAHGSMPLDIAVAWDPGNGATGDVLASLIRKIPGRHVLIHGAIDGTFPSRQPSQLLDQSLQDLYRTIEREGCDFGFAFDALGENWVMVERGGRVRDVGEVRRAFSLVEDIDPLKLALDLIADKANR